MTLRERIEWLLRMCLLVFVLAAAAFLSGVMAMRFAIQGREVDMPNLVGKKSADVQALLSARGLQLKVADRIYSEFPANTVVRQNPLSGTRAASLRVNLLIAQGNPPAAYIMPWLVGMQLPDADRLISSGGLKLAKTTFAAAPEWPKETIVEQTPGLGAKVTSDTPIELVIAQ